LDKETIRRYNEVVNMGERLLPAIASVIEESSDDFEIRTLLALTQEMKGDRSSLLPTVRKMMTNDSKWIRIDTVRTIGAIGGSPEAEYLLKFLEDRDQGVRKVTAQTLGEIGYADIADKMRIILAAREEGMSSDQISRDTSIAALEKAIEKIKDKPYTKPKPVKQKPVRSATPAEQTLPVDTKTDSHAPQAIEQKPAGEQFQSASNKPQPVSKVSDKTGENQMQWLIPAAIITGIVLAGAVIFLLTRRKGRGAAAPR
jgi:hypothetical protein